MKKRKEKHLEEKEVGKKFDQKKPDWSLLELKDIEEAVKVLTFGIEKYGRDNWKKVEDRENRYFAALNRHLKSYRVANENDNVEEMFDEETGLSHLSHALCCVLFLMEFQRDKFIEKGLIKKNDLENLIKRKL